MSTTKKFASQADLEEKKVTFSQISEHAWAYTCLLYTSPSPRD